MRCYLIDDDKIFHLLSQKMLQRSGIDVKVNAFLSAETALEALKQSAITYNDLPEIILLDIRMPKMDGFEFLDEYLQLPNDVLSKVRIFMLTSSIDERDVEKAKTYSCIKGFFNKPLSQEAITTILLNEGEHWNHTITGRG